MAIPFWAPTILSLVLGIPAIVVARRSATRAYRRKHRLCIGCGYDIRESKERCPECGKKFDRGMGALGDVEQNTGEAPVPQK